MPSQGPQAPLLIINEDDSIDTVVNAMKLFPDHPEVLEQALDYLAIHCAEAAKPVSTFSRLYSPSTNDDPRTKLLSSGVVPLLIAVLQNQASLQQKAKLAVLCHF